MALSNTSPTISYTADGTSTSYAYPFRILDSDDIAVYLDDVAQGSGFTVSGVDAASGGNVVFTSAPASGTVVLLQRAVETNRTIDYTDGGMMKADTFDLDMDRTVMMVQDLRVYADDQITFATAEKVAAQAAQTAAETAQAAAEAAQTAAETAESNAAASESAAATSETNAATSETNASTSKTAAAASATAAASSATAAAASETAAAASETAAASSETNAATSESNALSSKNAAATSATASATSATAAAASESAAAASETAAAASESAAAASETAAAASESAAATSETNAASSATSASSSASTATTQASNASTSASNAATSETNAASSASSASTSASTATTQASNASTSASAAATSATAAASSATSAATSATDAANSLDEFTDLYLGTKTSDPSVDNDGDALATGALYYDSSLNVVKVYNGSTWVAAYASLSGTLTAANNLGDLTSASAARTNLGLGSLATLSTITSSNITDGTIATADIADGAITSAKILDGTIATADIADGAITAAKLAAGAAVPSQTGHSGKYLTTDGTNASWGTIDFSPYATLNASCAPTANNTYDFGSGSNKWATIYATSFDGLATSAKYADLAERYIADNKYEAGTVVGLGGAAEVTANIEDGSTKQIGVISTAPAFVMNGGLEHENMVTVGYTGRLPCKVVGVVNAGDLLVAAGNGYARAEENPKLGSVVGKAITSSAGGENVIEIAVGRY